MNSPTTLDAEAISHVLSPADAVDAITETLLAGFDPADDIPRSTADTRNGHFLLMPTEAGEVAGIKVVTVAPNNPAHGLPRIQASYLLFDAETLSLQATLDGTALTTLRTPAVSAAAIRPYLRRQPDQLNLVVFGAGPQAVSHVDTLAAITTSPFTTVTFIVRTPDSASDDVRARGQVLQINTETANAAVHDADIIVCATSAREPLFSGELVKPSAIVIAVGSHEPEARELDSALMARSMIIVEDRDTALREAGDVIIAQSEGALDPIDLVAMRDVVAGNAAPAHDRPVVFKSVGMSWEDLAVAHAAFTRQQVVDQ